MTLKGSTPNEVYFRRYPANRLPRLEPRKQWHGDRGAPSPAHWSLGSRVIDSALKSATTTDIATFRSFR